MPKFSLTDGAQPKFSPFLAISSAIAHATLKFTALQPRFQSKFTRIESVVAFKRDIARQGP